jgi:membrane-bound lytic murein transglycosylase A
MIVATSVVSIPQSFAQYPVIKEGQLEPVTFTNLKGWQEDDHKAAFQTFLKSCQAVVKKNPSLRPAKPVDKALFFVCEKALSWQATRSDISEKTFFESYFTPYQVHPHKGEGFLTGYFEPEYEAALEKSQEFSMPLLDRPDDLITLAEGETLAGLDPSLRAARKTATGFEPYPDRASIEAGALKEKAKPVAWLRRPSEAFIIHVQGSARLSMRDGTKLRIAYAGRNGHAYTSIGRILAQTGRLPKKTMTLENLMSWLDEHPEEARQLMHQNRSYIFFRRAEELSENDGPIGGAGIPLTPLRSLAVDRNIWSYHLPIWLESTLPIDVDNRRTDRRLMIAQDTGSAIIGPARGDFFCGSGAEAGRQAGMMRHTARFTVLWPKPQDQIP